MDEAAATTTIKTRNDDDEMESLELEKLRFANFPQSKECLSEWHRCMSHAKSLLTTTTTTRLVPSDDDDDDAKKDLAVINARDDSGRTLLHMAAAFGELDVCLMLIQKYNANVNARNRQGRTPLHDAIDMRQMGACVLLIEHGADVNANDNGRGTPLRYAASRSWDAMCRLLLKHGADMCWPSCYQCRTSIPSVWMCERE